MSESDGSSFAVTWQDRTSDFCGTSFSSMDIPAKLAHPDALLAVDFAQLAPR